MSQPKPLSLTDQIVRQQERIVELEVWLAKAREVLKIYGKHIFVCKTFDNYNKRVKCTCGFEKAKEELNG